MKTRNLYHSVSTLEQGLYHSVAMIGKGKLQSKNRAQQATPNVFLNVCLQWMFTMDVLNGCFE